MIDLWEIILESFVSEKQKREFDIAFTLLSAVFSLSILFAIILINFVCEHYVK